MNSNQEGTLANFVAVTEAVRRARNDSQLLREVERHRADKAKPARAQKTPAKAKPAAAVSRPK